MPGNGNGDRGEGGLSVGGSSGGGTNGYWSTSGEGERQWISGPRPGTGLAALVPTGPEEPAPHVPVIREARNVQQANIDRSSLYDPTSATQALGADYLQQRNASNPQPLGATGAGAVGYEFVPSTERLY